MMMVIGTAVGQAAKTYQTLMAARVIQGFSTSAFESLIVAAVGDTFFVHERGLRVALITFILNSASSLASIICGQITANLGWSWVFHILQIFVVTQFILMFLFCPESTYIRDHIYDIDQVQDEKLGQLAETEHRREAGIKGVDENGVTVERTNTRPIATKKSFLQTLAIFTGTYTTDNIIKLVVGPFVTLLNVGACWSTVTSGLLCMWYVTSAIMQAGIFAGPPWAFNAAQIGYLSTGPFVGGAVGSAIMVFTSDPDHPRPCKIEWISPSLDPNTHSVRIRATLANPDGLLLADMYATMIVTIDPGRDSLVIPAEAVVRKDAAAFVFVKSAVKGNATRYRCKAVRIAPLNAGFGASSSASTALGSAARNSDGSQDMASVRVVEGVGAGDVIVRNGALGLFNEMEQQARDR